MLIHIIYERCRKPRVRLGFSTIAIKNTNSHEEAFSLDYDATKNRFVNKGE